MKTKSLLLFFVLSIFMFNTYAQQQPGRAPGNIIPTSVATNGLSQIFSVTGKYYLSADGGGSTASSYTVDVNKPSASSTVYKAYLMGASQGFSSYIIPDGCITLNSSPVNWNGTTASGILSYNHYSDVTSIVAPVMNAAGVGITSFTVSECGAIDGTALLVIFADPTTTEKTIVIMFGACSTGGDSFSLTLGTPIDPATPGAMLDMGLGISFGAQGQCAAQYSRVDINSQRLTTSAGGEDDGQLANGALITVGGLGDLNTNPADPNGSAGCNPRYDDELYSLIPFITNTTTSITVNTLNPSNDDNIFLSYFQISGVAIIGEGILLTQTTATGPTGVSHTVKAHLVDGLGAPMPGHSITFTVLAGPNAGTLGAAVTDVNGDAVISYTGAVVGTDNIQACLTTTSAAPACSNTLNYEWTGSATIPTMSQWGLIFLAIALLGVGTAYIMRRKSSDIIA